MSCKSTKDACVKSLSVSVYANMHHHPAFFVVVTPALPVNHLKRAGKGPQAAGTSNSFPFAKTSKVRTGVACICGEGIDQPLLQPPPPSKYLLAGGSGRTLVTCTTEPARHCFEWNI